MKRKIYSLLFCAASVVFASSASAQIITTVAGTDSVNFSGDNCPALNGTFHHPRSLTSDAVGNIFVVDRDNQRIRKISASGLLTSVAGSGNYGFSGDGGPATAASFRNPFGVAVDGVGNVYIADEENNRIRKINTSGIITTIAGNGLASYTGDGMQATATALKNPTGVAIDNTGNIYIADRGNSRIRKINTSGIISTLAGNGSFGFSGDGGPAITAELSNCYQVALDGTGNVYFSDQDNLRVRKINSSGIITTVAGNGVLGSTGDGGAATAAAIGLNIGISIDGSGNLYIADWLNSRIRKVSSSGIITTFVGGGSGYVDGSAATSVSITSTGVTASIAGNVFITDNYGGGICKINSFGIITTFGGNGMSSFGGDEGNATAGAFNTPSDVSIDASGNLYVADATNHRVRKISSGGTITTIAGDGTSGFSGDSGPATNASLWYPSATCVDPVGNIYIADLTNNRIRKVSTTGIISTFAGGGLSLAEGVAATAAKISSPLGVTADAFGNVYVCDNGHNRIRLVNAFGIITTIAGNGSANYTGDGGPATNATLHNPQGISIDSTGNIYIADSYNGCIRKVDLTGTITTFAGQNSGTTFGGDGGLATAAFLNAPASVFADHASNIYIADAGNHRIRKVDNSGIIYTVAGNGIAGYNGDGSLATTASLFSPNGVVADFSGNVYIADQGNNRIRKIGPCTYPPINPITGSPSMCINANTILSETTTGGTWSSANPLIASISTTGVVHGNSAGAVTISYSVSNTCGTSSATYSVSVNPLPSPGTITGASSVCPGSASSLTNLVTGGVWSSGSPSIATVSPTGVVTGLVLGSATISYAVSNSCGTAYATLPFTVSSTPVAGTISGVATTCISSTATLSDGISGGTWSSNDLLIATVDPSGVVTGVAAGNTTITYTVTNSCGTATATYPFTVSATPTAGTINGIPTVCEGAATSLSATIAGGSWTSDNTAIATVSATGNTAGISGGSVIISYTITSGCGTASTTTVVTVNPLPSAGAISGISNICLGATSSLSETVSGGTWSSSNLSIATVDVSGVVSAVTSGSAIISYSVVSPEGCSNYTTYAILSGITLPPSHISPASATLCGTASINLIVVSTASPLIYQWYKNGVLISGATSGSYSAATSGSYKAIITNGCGYDTLSAVTVSAAPNPLIHLTGTSTLYTGSYSTYQWYRNGIAITGAISSIYTYSLPGVYTVKVTDGNGCAVISSGYTVAGGVSGIPVISADDVKIFPNPASSSVNIDAPVKVNAVLLSVVGKVIIDTKDATLIDMSKLADGLYLIKIYDQDNQLLKTEKIIKQQH